MTITFTNRISDIKKVINIGNNGEGLVETLDLVLPKTYNSIDLSLLNLTLEWKTSAGYQDVVLLSGTVVGDTITTSWTLPKQVLAVTGTGNFCISFTSTDETVEFKTNNIPFCVNSVIDVDGTIIPTLPDSYTALLIQVATNTDDIATNASDILLKADKATTYTKTEVDTELSAKVDKVVGKELSTNDYTNVDKAKVDNVPSDTSAELNDKVNTTDIVDNLTSTDTDKPLSANQGKVLKDTQDTQETAIGLSTAHIANLTNPHVVTKTQLVIENVDNTSDLNKSISTATQAALDLKEVADVTILKQIDVVNNLASTSIIKPLSANQGKVLEEAKADKTTTYTKTEVDTELSAKVDKVTGKVLSTNDYTNVDKAKMNNVPSDTNGELNDKVNTTDIIDNLTSTDINKPLSANQGKELNDNLATLQAQVDVLETQIYGVTYNETTGVAIRTGDAVGLTLSEPDGIVPAPSDFDNHYPWNSIEHVKINKDGLRKEESEDDYEAFDGNYFTKIDTSHFYVKDIRAGGFRTIQIANMPLIGFHKIVDADEVLIASVGITIDDNGDYGAKLDKPFKVNTSYTTFNTNIIALGDGHHGMYDGVRSYVKEVLTYVEMGEMNDKKYFGRGINSGMPYGSTGYDIKTVSTGNTVDVDSTKLFYVDMVVQIGTAYSNNSIAQSRKITNIVDNLDGTQTLTVDGASFSVVIGNTCVTWSQPVPKTQFDAIGNGSGYINQFGSINKSHCCYRGMWDTYGNMWQLLGGWMRYDGEIFICSDPSKFNIVDPRGADGWVSTGHTPFAPNGHQKIREAIQIDGGSVSIPLEWGSGASSETFYSAYLYNFTDVYMGARVLRVGGYWSYGARVSPVCSGGDYSPASTNVSVGSHLIRY